MSEQRQPRVLHIGKYLPPVPGGIETYLGDLLRVSMRHGLEVGAVVHGKTGYPDPDPADFAGAKIYTVPTYGQLLYAPVAPTFPWVLKEAIREFKPDILHMHVPNTSAFWALLIPEARKIPWVLHWHADVDVGKMSLAMRAAYRAYKLLETAILIKARLIVATSEDYLAASEPLQPWRSKCQIIPLGIDIERLIKPTVDQVKQARDLWPRSSETRFLAVGRLAYYKGYDSLIRAMVETTEGSLVIVGDGEMKAALSQLISTLRVNDRVTLVGTLPSQELSACYAAADVFCMASVDRSEAFGVVLLEAAHYGCRIVAREITGSGVVAVVRKLDGILWRVSTSPLVFPVMPSDVPSHRHLRKFSLPKEFLLTSDNLNVWTDCYERAIV